jgi:anti-sigma factor RsiW
MNCREFLDFLMDYLDDELPGGQRRVFESHMSECPSCVTYLDTYRETLRIGRRVLCPEDGSLPEEAPAELVEAILAARRAGGQPPEK